MKVVYVAGPFRMRAESVALDVCRLGAAALCPHAMYRYYQDSLPDAFWLEATMELLRRCDAIVMCGGWRISSGSIAERDEALRLAMPVFGADDLPALKDWIRNG